MEIKIKTISGKTIVVKAEENDTIRHLKAQVEARESVPIREQRLIYGGKDLPDGYTLRDYSITDISTLHLILPPGHDQRNEPPKPWPGRPYALDDDFFLDDGPLSDLPAQTSAPGLNAAKAHTQHPNECAFPRSYQANASILAWENKGISGQFDADIAIVDPQAHYCRLENIEREAVEASEWYRTRGKYLDSFGNDYKTQAELCENHHFNSLLFVRSGLSNTRTYRLDSLEAGPDTTHTSSNHAEIEVLQRKATQPWQDSVRKTYFMLCRIIDAFETLQRAEFCTDYYSILLERGGGNVAEIVKIPGSLLGTLKMGLVYTITPGNDGNTTSFDNVRYPCVKACDIVFQNLQIECNLSESSDESILNTLRTIVLLLDLGLVSYACSHTSDVDLHYLHERIETFPPDERRIEAAFHFSCRRRQLACLDGFLDNQAVWTFRCSTGENHSVPTPGTTGQPIMILTHIEEFADIWGPVWSVLAKSENPDSYAFHNVSKGVIWRAAAKSTRSDGAIRCHWDPEESFYWRRRAIAEVSAPSLLLRKADLLLIGARFRDNDSCHYTMEEFEAAYGQGMGVLGTERSIWELDERQAGLSFSKVIGVQISGTQKRRPQTSLKQSILARWKLAPETANPAVLNHYLGVEISHCTGNARRIPLKRLLTLRPVREMLDLQFPGWNEEEWGIALLAAAESQSTNDIFKLWCDHQAHRKEVGALVNYVLQVLDKTGNRDNGLVAAFFHNHQESSVTFEQKYNEYSCMLGDSHLMATYAVVTDACIECHTPEHSTSICGNTQAWTALETRLAIRESAPETASYSGTATKIPDWVKIDPTGYFLKTIDKRSADGLLMMPGSNATTTGAYVLSSFHNGTPPSAVELRDAGAQGGMHHKVFLRSHTKSYGGMRVPRARKPRPPLPSNLEPSRSAHAAKKLPPARSLDPHEILARHMAAPASRDVNATAGAQDPHNNAEGTRMQPPSQQVAQPQRLSQEIDEEGFFVSPPSPEIHPEAVHYPQDSIDAEYSDLDSRPETYLDDMLDRIIERASHGSESARSDTLVQSNHIGVTQNTPVSLASQDEPAAVPEADPHEHCSLVSTLIAPAPNGVLTPSEHTLVQSIASATAKGTMAGDPSIIGRPTPILIRTRDKLLNKLRWINKTAA